MHRLKDVRQPRSQALSILCAITLAALVSLSARLRADEVVLKSNRTIQGKVIGQDEKSVRLQTAAGSTLNLPRSIIESVTIEEVGPEETLGDLALAQRDYLKALRRYREAKAANNASKGIDKKIRQVLEIVNRKEREQFDRLFEEALRLIQSGEHPEARLRLDRIEKAASEGGPYWTLARRAKALTYFRAAQELLDRVQYVPAIRSIEKAVQADPSLASGFLALADLYSNHTSEIDQADRYYKKGIEVGTRELDREPEERAKLEALAPPAARLDKDLLIGARYDHAALKYQLGRKLEAAEDFLKLIEEHADVMDREKRDSAIRNIVDAYTSVDLTQEFDQDKVLRQLDVALEKDPGAGRAWFLKGLIYIDDNRTSEAVHAFSRAIDVEPRAPDRHLKRAEAYLSMGKLQLARADLQKELDIFERYSVRVKLSEVFLAGADYDRAIENFTIAINNDSDQVPALLGRARAHRRKALIADLGSTKRNELLTLAETDVHSVISLKGDLLDALLVLGQIYKDRKRYDLAMDHFTRVIEGLQRIKRELTDPEKTSLARAHTERGDIHLRRNDRNLARSDFRKALDVRDDFAPAYSQLGHAAKLVGDHKTAREYYAKAIALAPLNADYELHMAILLHQYVTETGYAQGAIQHYQAYLDKGGKEMRVHDWIRECRAGIAKGEKEGEEK